MQSSLRGSPLRLLPARRPAFELVLFDCDGVLVDTEALACEVLRDMLADIGLRLSAAEVAAHFVGRSVPDCVLIAERLLGRPLPEGFAAEIDGAFIQTLSEHARAIPGIEKVLTWLSESTPFCVASSGSPDKIRASLTASGLLPWFEGRIFSVAQVMRPKPAPDLFEHAARKLGVTARRCCVVEDSSVGVAAGIAAGMTVFGFCRDTPADRLMAAGASMTFASMHELPALLAGDASPSERPARR